MMIDAILYLGYQADATSGGILVLQAAKPVLFPL